DRTQLRQVTAYAHALAGQVLARDGAGRHAHRRFPRRGAPAAAVVAHAVLLPIRIICMSRTKQILDIAVILALLILVLDEHADGRARGDALEYARQDAHPV